MDAKYRTQAFIGDDPLSDLWRLLLCTIFLAVLALKLARSIQVIFVSQAAHEASADTGYLRRIEGHALTFCHADGYGLEITQEGSAA